MAGQPTLRQLKTFVAVIDTGSISAAARLLTLTQPAVSQQMRDLEQTLDASLLERVGGRVLATAAGSALVAPARCVVTAAEDAVAAVAEHGGGQSGRLRIGTGATACIHLLPPILATVKRKMPGLNIAVVIGNTADVVPRVECGDLDIAFATQPIYTQPHAECRSAVQGLVRGPTTGNCCAARRRFGFGKATR